MRKRLLMYLAMGMALTFLAACRDARPQAGEDGLQVQDAEAIEDSGRRLTGNFVVQSFADDYASNSAQAVPRWAFSFQGDGGFRSERDVRGAARVEEGHYVISAAGELVLYIETVAGEALSGARLERYQIEAQGDAELRLRRSGSVTLVLQKR